MGNLLSNILSLFEKKPIRLIMIGLEGAGKTTVLYKLNLVSEIVPTISTIGFNVESVEDNNIILTVWDIGGNDSMRRLLWRHYYQNATGIIFVVDSNDRERVIDAKEEIGKLLLEHSLKNVPLLILANKQDLKDALKISELVESLNLNSIKDRKWFIHPTIAVHSQGIYEGLELLSNAIKNN